MATTDTRSGFRLPWSSDRTPEDPAVEDSAAETPADPDPSPASAAPAWPETDFESRIGFTAAHQRPTDAPVRAQEAPPMVAEQPAAPPRKPTKLMADLAAAIRATTEAARDQRLGQLESEAAGIVDMIRAQSDEGAVALRRHSDEDVTAIRDWAKAEIARIKEESESRIADRKHQLEREVADHAAAIEDRVSEVHSTVDGYRAAMDAYFERLQAEEDPARLATMAEAMPEPPTLQTLTDLEDLAIDGAAERRAALAAAEAEPEPVAESTTEPVAAESVESGEHGDHSAEALLATAEHLGSVLAAANPGAVAHLGGSGNADAAEGDAPAGHGEGEAPADDVPRWSTDEAPEGFPEPSGGDPVDRGAIMAALEAAAEAVVAAEAAAESAETAEAAADVAETAAELVAGRAGQQSELDPEAQAALSARVDAGGFDTESYADRLASLLPGHAEASADGEPRTTQVVVTGLVSVASIASFKRHLGRLAGVNTVAVASGPDGEFIFNVSHRPDVSFRDAIPTMPGFAARVVATGDGVVSVTAHDPEAEG